MSASWTSRRARSTRARARGLRVAQAIAERRRVHEQAHELLGRAVDHQRQLVRDERVDDASRGHHGVAAAQRHGGVSGLALDDEAELRRALLPALDDVDAAAAALQEVPPALVDHVVGPDQVRAVLDQPAGAADRALLLVGGAGVDERAGGGAAGGGDARRGHGVGGDQVLDVDGAAAPDVAVTDQAGEGRHLPVGGVGGHDVLVGEEQQRRAGLARLEAQDEALAALGLADDLAVEAARAANQAAMNSATCVSLPGGLLVSIRMSALSSSLVSRSTSATAAGSMPAMSSTTGPPVLHGDVRSAPSYPSRLPPRAQLSSP